MLRHVVLSGLTCISFAFFASVSPPAVGQTVQNLAGTYLFANGDFKNEYKCLIKLTLKKVGENFRVEIPTDCREHMGAQSITAWKFYNHMIVFVSEGGSPILTFGRNEEVEASSSGFYFEELLGDGMRGTRYIEGKSRR